MPSRNDISAGGGGGLEHIGSKIRLPLLEHRDNTSYKMINTYLHFVSKPGAERIFWIV